MAATNGLPLRLAKPVRENNMSSRAIQQYGSNPEAHGSWGRQGSIDIEPVISPSDSDRQLKLIKPHATFRSIKLVERASPDSMTAKKGDIE